MGDNAIRAIMIGVGAFVVIIVLTGVILYVNTARNMTTTVDENLSSWDDVTIDNIMDYNGDVEIECTGADLINFLRINFSRSDVRLAIAEEGNSVPKYENFKQLSVEWGTKDTDGISAIKLAKINASASLKMKKEYKLGDYLITVTGDVFSNRDLYVTDNKWLMQKQSDGLYAYVSDGEQILEIGDAVEYGSNSYYVLGAESGRLLLLRIVPREVAIDSNEFVENKNKLSKFNTFTSNLGVSRCLNISDIERLTDVSSDYSDYGKIYNLNWGISSSIGKKEWYVNIDSTANLFTETFYWYDKSSQSVKYVEKPDGKLPTLKIDCYIDLNSSKSIEEGYLSEGARKMLEGIENCFLMNISTIYSQGALSEGTFYYTATCLEKLNITEKAIFDAKGKSANAPGVINRFNVYQVIEVKPDVTISEVDEHKWKLEI